MSTPPKLTTTSYAILGLLAIQPWSTYELARHMGRSLGPLWPRAESKLYEEPKKLVAAGLATATPDAVGRRRRTVYAISAEGRRALAEWLALPGAGPVLEWEQLMKIFFSEHGTKLDALAAIAAARRWAEDRQREHATVASSYLDGTGPFPQRAAQLALTARFLVDFADTVARWAQWADGVVAAWPDDPAQAQPDWAMFEAVAHRGEPAVHANRGRGRPPHPTRPTAPA